MIWANKPTLESLQKLCANSMSDHLGIVFTEIGEDYLIAKMPVDHRTQQPAGILHGGASVVLAESLGSIASALCIQGTTKMPVGIEVNANHLKTASSGYVFGKVSSIRRGQTLHVWNIEIQNEKSELICISRLTVMIVNRKV